MDFFSLRVSSVKNLAGLLSFVSVVLYIMYKTMWIVVFTRTSHVRSIDTTLLHIFSSSVCLFEITTDSEAVQRVVHMVVLDNTVFFGQVVHKFSQATATQRKVWNWLTKNWALIHKKKPKFSKCFHFNAIIAAISCWKNYC